MQKTHMKKNTNFKHCNGPKAFIEYSYNLQDVYKDIEEYNPGKNCQILTSFDDMITDMISNKKLNPIVTEVFSRGRKRNISLVFITQSYLKLPKDVRVNSMYYFFIKILNKRELQHIAKNHSPDIE